MMVQGYQQLTWWICKIIREEVVTIQNHFFEILMFLEEEMGEAYNKLEKVAMIAKSLGCKILMDLIVKSFKKWYRLSIELEAFFMEEGLYLF